MDQRDEQMYSRYTRPGLVPVFFHVICFFSCAWLFETFGKQQEQKISCEAFIVNMMSL